MARLSFISKPYNIHYIYYVCNDKYHNKNTTITRHNAGGGVLLILQGGGGLPLDLKMHGAYWE